MKRMLYLATICFAAVGHHVAAMADSPGFSVTPDNLDKHALGFTVSVACRPENDPKLCQVVIGVASKDPAVAPRLHATLGVRDDSGCIVSCPLEGKTTEHGMLYQCSVANRYIRTSDVVINDENDEASRSVSGYWLQLGDFMQSPGTNPSR